MPNLIRGSEIQPLVEVVAEADRQQASKERQELLAALRKSPCGGVRSSERLGGPTLPKSMRGVL
jgi:hypothetical protein